MARAGSVVRWDELAEFLWEAAPPRHARVVLRNYAMRLRHALGDAVGARILTRDSGYVLDAGEGEVDTARFVALCRSGGAALRDGDLRRAQDYLCDAMELWRGEPFVDVPSETLRREEVPRLEQWHLQAWEWHIEVGLRLGRHDELVPELRTLVTSQPLHEHFHAQLMLALHRSGRPAEALSVYRRIRRALVDELGVEPGPRLRGVQQWVLAGDPEPPAATPAGSWTVPRQLPITVRHFAGRTRELAALTDQLREVPGAVLISAIDGTAGVGKTTLAVHWAHQVAGHFPDGQLYVNLRGFGPTGAPVATERALRGLLAGLGVPADRAPASLDAQIGLYRSLLADRRVLVMLDNARDAEQVRPLLPGGPGCLTVITSRGHLAGLVAAEDARAITLDVLGHGEARELLNRRLGTERVAAETDAADELVDLCARLPLALCIAAALAATDPRQRLGTLVAGLRDTRCRLDVLDTGDAVTSMRAVFSWSYRSLRPAAAGMFRLLGLHPGPDLTVAAAAATVGVDVPSARVLLDELARAHLLTGHTPGRYVLHDLLRAYAAEQADRYDSEDERRAATHRMLDFYLHSSLAAALRLNTSRRPVAVAPCRPGVRPRRFAGYQEALAWFDAEQDVLLAVTALATGSGFADHTWQLPWTLADYFDRQGRWGQSAQLQRTALVAVERGGDRIGQANAHRILGTQCVQLGAHDEGVAHLRRALEEFRRLEDEVGQANVHHDLAWALGRQGMRRQALGHAQQALAQFRAVGHLAGVASALNSLGWDRGQLGDYRRTLTYCQNALALHNKLGNQHGAAMTRYSLGLAHHHLGRHREAIGQYLRALELSRTLGDHYLETELLTHLGDSYHATGAVTAAHTAWQQALRMLDVMRHPDAKAVRAKLAKQPAS